MKKSKFSESQIVNILKEAEAGKINKAEAAEKILHLREEIDKVLEHLRSGR